jgi:DNA (cytosine-5)-methyltransferase 1
MVNEMTMQRPRLLDLFCGAGGAAMGYHRAGFHVVGLDIRPQKHFPFEFHQGDALDYLAEHGREFDVIHASPPCQRYSSLKFLHQSGTHVHADMVGPTRQILVRLGRPWVIENVPNAPLRHPIVLCGSMFDLGTCCRDGQYHQLRRHRLFESPVQLVGRPCAHDGRPVGVYGHGGSWSSRSGSKGFQCLASEGRIAMGIDWMNRDELAQAIPPAYTEYIGKQLMQIVNGKSQCPGR